MNKQFSLKMKFIAKKKGRMSNLNNNAEATVHRSSITKIESQREEAVAWCRENECCVYLALKSGLFLLIKHRISQTYMDPH